MDKANELADRLRSALDRCWSCDVSENHELMSGLFDAIAFITEAQGERERCVAFARYVISDWEQVGSVGPLETLYTSFTATQLPAAECEHEEGDSEYGGRGKCVKCGDDHPKLAEVPLVEEWAAWKKNNPTRARNSVVALDAAMALIDRRLSASK